MGLYQFYSAYDTVQHHTFPTRGQSSYHRSISFRLDTYSIGKCLTFKASGWLRLRGKEGVPTFLFFFLYSRGKIWQGIDWRLFRSPALLFVQEGWLHSDDGTCMHEEGFHYRVRGMGMNDWIKGEIGNRKITIVGEVLFFHVKENRSWPFGTICLSEACPKDKTSIVRMFNTYENMKIYDTEYQLIWFGKIQY